MANMRQAFERDLRAKLDQKSSAHTTDETVLLRAFKYFDLDNSGSVDKNEWLKTLDRVGVNAVDTMQQLELFDVYDKDGSGALDYHEFIAAVFGGECVQGRSLAAQSSRVDYLAAEEALQFLREKLASRGARGIIGFARQFRIMDDDNSRLVEFPEFAKAVHDYRVPIQDAALQQVFAAIDRDQSGTINYDEFLRALRGPMNEFRRNLVLAAFDKLDQDRSGAVDVSEVKQIYDASGHPDVRSGRKSEDDVLEEFLETFELHHAMEGRADHIVTRDEFLEYYSNISASIDNDGYFEQMINNAWKLKEAPAYTKQKAWTNVEKTQTGAARSQQAVMCPGRRQAVRSGRPAAGVQTVKPTQSDLAVVEEFRKQLAKRGARGIIGMQRQFKIIDDNNSRSLDQSEFVKACRDYRVNLPDKDVVRLFHAFDRDNGGSIDYDEFLRVLRGPMNEFRASLVQQAFRKLDRDSSGVIDINDLRDFYSGKNHPDVRAGKKTEDEVLEDFLETFELHHNMSDASSMDHRVTVEEFVEYYTNISASIDDDAYFETMMTNAWRLQGTVATRDAWAGQIGGHEFNPNHKVQWLVDHHRSQFTGSVTRSAPFGTFDEATDYHTELRPANERGGGDLLTMAQQTRTAGQPSWPSNMSTGNETGVASIEQILGEFRHRLVSRGARGIIGLSRQFRIMDDSGNKRLEFPEFVKACHDYRISVPEQDLQRVFRAFDADGNGSVDYDEFLRVIRGELNEFRTGLVDRAFSKLDTDGSGVISAEEVKRVFDARNHPDVRMGKKTEDEVLTDFLGTFETHHSITKGGAGLDGRVTLDEFREYYANVSASIDDDRYFELMMKNAWNLDNRAAYKPAWAGEVEGRSASKQRYL